MASIARCAAHGLPAQKPQSNERGNDGINRFSLAFSPGLVFVPHSLIGLHQSSHNTLRRCFHPFDSHFLYQDANQSLTPWLEICFSKWVFWLELLNRWLKQHMHQETLSKVSLYIWAASSACCSSKSGKIFATKDPWIILVPEASGQFIYFGLSTSSNATTWRR